jgi:hypothetical protein
MVLPQDLRDWPLVTFDLLIKLHLDQSLVSISFLFILDGSFFDYFLGLRVCLEMW